MNPAVELLASYWTISAAYPHTDRECSRFDFEDRVVAASRAGFKGFGLWHADLEHILQSRTLRDMKQIFDDHGISHIELEFLTDWFLDGEKKKQSDARKRLLLTAAEALGARHIKVGDFFQTPCPLPKLTESFAALCTDAAAHGTRICFELMPFSMLPTLEDSLAMIEGAGAENGGITLDLWHIVKLKIPYEKIASIPPKYLGSVELNDGSFEAPWSLHEDTVNHRRFCGEGEFDVRGFIAAVRHAGYDGPWGIEVLSEDLRLLPLDELTTRAFRTTLAQFQP